MSNIQTLNRHANTGASTKDRSNGCTTSTSIFTSHLPNPAQVQCHMPGFEAESKGEPPTCSGNTGYASRAFFCMYNLIEALSGTPVVGL